MGNGATGDDISPEEARLREAMKQLKLLHIKVSPSTHDNAGHEYTANPTCLTSLVC